MSGRSASATMAGSCGAVLSRVANWMMAKLSGIELHDFGTTFKAYRHEIIQEIQLYGGLHRFIPALAGCIGAKIAEVPISNLKRKSGKSNYSNQAHGSRISRSHHG